MLPLFKGGTMVQQLLETADAARVLGLTPASVRQLAKRGVLAAVTVTPRGVRLFARDAVERLARERATVVDAER
jgi:hypothetical protein